MNDDIYNMDLNMSNQYEKKLVNLNAGIDILLDEFKKIYVITKTNPTDQEYHQKYQNITNSLSEILSNLFTISKDIHVNTNDINKKVQSNFELFLDYKDNIATNNFIARHTWGPKFLKHSQFFIFIFFILRTRKWRI